MNKVESMNGCELCDLLQCNRIHFKDDFISTNNVIYETKSFVVIPDKLPITQLHSLIVSKRCVCGMANLNRVELCELDELIQIYDTIIEEKTGKKSSHFEHGSVSINGNGGNSVYHFHYHNIFLNESLEKEISKKINVSYQKINSYMEIFDRKGEYLLYENGYDEKFLFNIETNIESQFLRKIVYEHTNEKYKPSSYDWKAYENRQFFVENKNRLKRIFSNN